MLGFKIIREIEYKELMRVKDGRKKIEEDCASLREQLGEKMMRLNTLGRLNNLHILKAEDYPCAKCGCKSDKCMKLTFANQTICVIEKKYVNNFTKKNKK